MAAMKLPAGTVLKQAMAQLRGLARRLKPERYRLPLQPEPRPEAANTARDIESEPTAAATQVTFLPRDPQWAIVSWTISPTDRQRVTVAGERQLCLRVADVTGLPVGATHPQTLQELVVEANATQWYLPVPLCDRDYQVELGYRLSAGGWLSLAVSAVARVPAQGPSPALPEPYAPFSIGEPIQALNPQRGSGGVEHERLYQLATSSTARTRRVGSEVLHEQELHADHAGQLHDSGAGLWASGRNASGQGLERQRSFWLVADAELIVYGATEPSARLWIGDQQVPLDADGCFRVHVPFADGDQTYPIRAVAADGEQQRSIRLAFQRRTPEARVNRREEAVSCWF